MSKLTPEDLDKMGQVSCDKPKDWIKVGMSSRKCALYGGQPVAVLGSFL